MDRTALEQGRETVVEGLPLALALEAARAACKRAGLGVRFEIYALAGSGHDTPPRREGV